MRAIRLGFAPLATLAALACLPPGAAPRAQTPPAAAAPADAATPAPDTVVARVDGEEIHLSDIATAAQQLPPQMQNLPPATLYPVLLDQLVDGKALVLMARRQKLDQDPAVQQQIRRAEDQALQTALITREIGPMVTEEAIHARYEKEIAGKPGEEEVQAAHILVATEAEARKVIAELQAGADFATLAKQHSTDPGGAQGGDLGFFKKGEMVPAFADAAFAMKPGEISKDPVKTQFGWHVIKVEARREAPPETYEAAHDELRKAIIRENMAKLLVQAHAGLKIEKFRPDGTLPSATDSAEPPPARKP